MNFKSCRFIFTVSGKRVAAATLSVCRQKGFGIKTFRTPFEIPCHEYKEDGQLDMARSFHGLYFRYTLIKMDRSHKCVLVICTHDSPLYSLLSTLKSCRMGKGNNQN